MVQLRAPKRLLFDPVFGPFYGTVPIVEQRISLVGIHGRLITPGKGPEFRDIPDRSEVTDADSPQKGAAQSSGIANAGDFQRNAENIGLELHQKPVGGRTAVAAERCGKPALLVYNWEDADMDVCITKAELENAASPLRGIYSADGEKIADSDAVTVKNMPAHSVTVIRV